MPENPVLPALGAPPVGPIDKLPPLGLAVPPLALVVPLLPGVPPAAVLEPPVAVAAPELGLVPAAGSVELQPAPATATAAHINPLNETATEILRIITSSDGRRHNGSHEVTAHLGMAGPARLH
jgi:hypothetical protein